MVIQVASQENLLFVGPFALIYVENLLRAVQDCINNFVIIILFMYKSCQ